MEPRSRHGEAFSLRTVTVRPTPGAAERCLQDTLMAAHHYLPHKRLFGKCLRPITLSGAQWLTLAGWQAEPSRFRHLPLPLIDWTPTRQCRRLHLIVYSSRSAVLPADGPIRPPGHWA